METIPEKDGTAVAAGPAAPSASIPHPPPSRIPQPPNAPASAASPSLSHYTSGGHPPGLSLPPSPQLGRMSPALSPGAASPSPSIRLSHRRSLPSPAGTIKSVTERRVHLRKVVQDAYEYHGLWDLALFTGFAVLCTLVLFFHWEPTTAAFKNTMQNSFVSWGENDWEQSELFQKTSIYEGYQYLTGYLDFHLQKSKEQAYNEPVVRIDDYGDIVFARLLINVERSCQVHNLPCFRSALNDTDKRTNETFLFRQQPPWKVIRHKALRNQNSLKSSTDWIALNIITQDDVAGNNATRDRFIDNLSKAADDAVLQYIGRYAYAVVLEMFIQDVLHPADGATFAIHVQRTNKPDSKIRTGLVKFTTIHPTRTSFYRIKRSTYDMGRAVIEALFLVLLLLHTRGDLRQFHVCWAQHKDRDKLKFIKYHWNNIQIVSTILLYVWAVWYIVLIVMTMRYAPEFPPKTDHDLHNLLILGTIYSQWLWGYIVVTGLLAIRMLRYMRIHVGLRAFYQVFVIAAKELTDFAFIMAYIILLLGAAVFAFFQLSGGNNQFLQFDSGLSVMARLTFNVLDYVDFYNYGLGLGTSASAVTGLFWISMILLQVFSLNVILAIVARAYDEAKAMLGTPECSFFSLIVQRMLFGAIYALHWAKSGLRWLCNRNSFATLTAEPEGGEDAEAGPARHTHISHAQSFISMFKSTDEHTRSRRKVGMRQNSVLLYDKLLAKSSRSSGVIARWTKARWAAWALVRNREFLALVALYQDFATLKLKRQRQWDTDAILQPGRNTDPAVPPVVVVPDLEAHVTADELQTLLRTVNSLHKHYGRTPNPFQPIPDELIPDLTTAIMDVYGWQAEAVSDRLQEEEAELLPAVDPTTLSDKQHSAPQYSTALGMRTQPRPPGNPPAVGPRESMQISPAVASQLGSIQEQLRLLQEQNRQLVQLLANRSSMDAPRSSMS